MGRSVGISSGQEGTGVVLQPGGQGSPTGEVRLSDSLEAAQTPCVCAHARGEHCGGAKGKLNEVAGVG